jgi:DNA-binding transcriptional LysR family regulator
MDRLEAMSIWMRVAETGSFSAASRQLGMPLATVSRKVGELEAHLGTKLLTRSTRKVALTEAGAIYLSSAKRILEDVDETERIAAGEFEHPRGELVLTAPVLFGRLHILPLVTDFLALHPDIRVRLVLSDRNLHLIDDHVDAALRIGPLPDSRMVATRIGSMRTVVCAEFESPCGARQAARSAGSRGATVRALRYAVGDTYVVVSTQGHKRTDRAADQASSFRFDCRGRRLGRRPRGRRHSRLTLSMRGCCERRRA